MIKKKKNVYIDGIKNIFNFKLTMWYNEMCKLNVLFFNVYEEGFLWIRLIIHLITSRLLISLI